MSEKISSKGESIRGRADFIPFIPRVKAFGPNQTITDSTNTSVAMGTSEEFDTDTIHDLVTNSSRLTVKTAGVYFVRAQATWDTVGAGLGGRLARLYKNGATEIARSAEASPPASINHVQEVTALIELAVGDYIELFVFQNRGGNLDVQNPQIAMTYIGPGFNAVRVKPVISYVTPVQFAALTPLDGDEVYLVVDATNGIVWHLRYNAGSSSAYKWEFLGGSSLRASVATQEQAGSTGVYVDLATALSVTAPRGGDYAVSHSATGINATSANSSQYLTTIINSESAQRAGVSQPRVQLAGGGTLAAGITAVEDRLLALSSGDIIRQRYNVAAVAAGYFDSRVMIVKPVRIS